jgi:hypothetical protein
MKTTITLTDEKLQDIYTDEQFRNQVANAHSCLDSNHNFKHKQTCSYPTTYIVTEEQIELAKVEKLRAKEQFIKDHENALIFIGMGMTYEPTEGNDVGNYRVRTQFTNPNGRTFFIEVCGGSNDYKSHVTYSIDVDLQKRRESEKPYIQDYYNYNGLERNANPIYTKESLLSLVNRQFDCNFSEIIIDNYNLSPDDITCKSPN